MSEWKTIDTAPQNTEVIIYGTLKSWFDDVFDYMLVDSLIGDEWQLIDCSCPNYEDPTHWMPVPDKPETQ